MTVLRKHCFRCARKRPESDLICVNYSPGRKRFNWICKDSIECNAVALRELEKIQKNARAESERAKASIIKKPNSMRKSHNEDKK